MGFLGKSHSHHPVTIYLFLLTGLNHAAQLHCIPAKEFHSGEIVQSDKMMDRCVCKQNTSLI